MSRRDIKFTCKDVRISGYTHNEVELTVEGVDVADFLDADMALDELEHRDLLNKMNAADVADWLRGEGYNVEEE